MDEALLLTLDIANLLEATVEGAVSQ